MVSGDRALLVASLAAALVLTAGARSPLQTAGAGDINWLATLLRSLQTTVSDTQPPTGWHKRSDTQPKCAGPSDSSGSVTGANNDTEGEPLNSEDFDSALQSQHDGRPVDEPIMNADDYGTDDDIVCSEESVLTSPNVPNNAIQDDDERWPGAEVPYTIASGFSSADRRAIASGVLQLESRTCVRLRARTAADRHYVRIIRGSGCYSSVGRQRTGGQELSLGTGCLFPGIVAHELMHAIGFWHEQSRPDRDQYVYIHYDNIKSGTLHNFDKYTWKQVQNLSMPYDVGSIMHYGPRAFAYDSRRPTITALHQTSVQMGQRHSLSLIDINKINRLYQCNGATLPPTASNCTDNNINCAAWADAGECDKNPLYMRVHCALSCDSCSEQVSCEDKNEHCRAWALRGECNINPPYMRVYCRKACELCSDGGSTEDCRDDNEYCQAWADAGECAKNPRYMQQSCRRACALC